MMRRTLPTLLAALLLAVPAIAAAQVYKWKDANGIVHFSDSPPPQGVKYENVRASSRSTARAPTAPPKDEQGDGKPAKASGSKGIPDTPDNRKRYCAELQSNIDLLKSDTPVHLTGDDKKELDAKMRQSRLQQAQQRYQTFCSK